MGVQEQRIRYKSIIKLSYRIIFRCLQDQRSGGQKLLLCPFSTLYLLTSMSYSYMAQRHRCRQVQNYLFTLPLSSICIYLMKNFKLKPLRVATLNFSGINVSPFEYHDGSTQKHLINQCFRKLLDEFQKSHPDSQWNIAKIDKILQRERYSILYKPTAGVVRGRLLDRTQYEVVWDSYFEQNQHLVSHLTPSQDSINLLRSFDWMMYQAFVTTLYGKINWTNMSGYNVQRYIEDLRKWHQKNYLKWQPKINYVKNYIIRQNLDILFLQEAGHQKLEASIPEDYIPFRAGEAMIIVKKSFVVEDPEISKFHLKYGSRLNFNHDSHYVKLKHYLLCCAHLSSKSLNKKQAEEVQGLFKEIREDYQGLNIIAGIDANHFLSEFTYLNVFPAAATEATTRKKRSSMQLQFEKSQKLIQEAKDHLITNLLFEQIKVETIHCEQTSSDLLPNQNHPYDHFIVFGTLRIKQRQEDNAELEGVEHNPNITNRYRRASLATTEGPSNPDNRVLVISQCTSQVKDVPRTNTIEARRKTQCQIDYTDKETCIDRLRLSEASTYLEPRKVSIPIFSRSNDKYKGEESNPKPQLFYKMPESRAQEGQQKQKYYNQGNIKLDQQFLQFSRSPKMGGAPPLSKPYSRVKEPNEERNLTPKRDKSKELNPGAHKF